jgi:multiple sugar transport system permease protein
LKRSRLRAAGEYFDRHLWAYALVAPSLIMVGVVIVYPMATGILMSFQEIRLLRPDSQGFIGLQNYRYMLSDGNVSAALVNTGIWVFVGVLAQFTLGMGAALLMNMKFRFIGVARLCVMLPFFMPPVVTSHMWALMLNPRLGVINDVLVRVGILDEYRAWFADPTFALPTVMAVELWRSYPLFALFLLAGLLGIPEELNEAAKVDGATALKRFRYITLPLLRPVIMVASILQVIRLANSPDLLLILTGGGPGNASRVISLYAFQLAYAEYNFGYAATIAVVLMFCLSIFTVIYVRIVGVKEGD